MGISPKRTARAKRNQRRHLRLLERLAETTETPYFDHQIHALQQKELADAPRSNEETVTKALAEVVDRINKAIDGKTDDSEKERETFVNPQVPATQASIFQDAG